MDLVIRQVRWTAVSVPFREPFVTSRGTVTERELVIVRVEMDGGIVGLGEVVTPLGTGQAAFEHIPAARYWADRQTPGRDAEEILAILRSGVEHPEMGNAWVGLETALYDAMGRAQEAPVAALLGPHVGAVPVNATIGVRATTRAVEKAKAAKRQGFRTIKLKVGQGTVQEDVERVAAVRSAVGADIALRVDANGAWDAGTAIEAITSLASYQLEYVEQPVTARAWRDLKRVRERVPVPIAADESVDIAREHVVGADVCDVLVIKPLVLGGLAATKALIGAAGAAHQRVVVTTSIDSGIGTAAALQVAAALPAPVPACGLATADLLVDDLVVSAPRIENGSMSLPPAPGLGVELDEDAVARFEVPVPWM